MFAFNNLSIAPLSTTNVLYSFFVFIFASSLNVSKSVDSLGVISRADGKTGGGTFLGGGFFSLCLSLGLEFGVISLLLIDISLSLLVSIMDSLVSDGLESSNRSGQSSLEFSGLGVVLRDLSGSFVGSLLLLVVGGSLLLSEISELLASLVEFLSGVLSILSSLDNGFNSLGSWLLLPLLDYGVIWLVGL